MLLALVTLLDSPVCRRAILMSHRLLLGALCKTTHELLDAGMCDVVLASGVIPSIAAGLKLCDMEGPAMLRGTVIDAPNHRPGHVVDPVLCRVPSIPLQLHETR